MLLARRHLPGGSYKLVDANFSQKPDPFVSANLKKGIYVLYVKIEWKHWNEKNFNVGCYGPAASRIYQTDKIPRLIEDVFTNLAKSNIERKNYDKLGECYTVHQLDNLHGYHFKYIQYIYLVI